LTGNVPSVATITATLLLALIQIHRPGLRPLQEKAASADADGKLDARASKPPFRRQQLCYPSHRNGYES
jgi:hypothetical protein